jgi:zinc finger HIT domain-containing protein 3
MLQLHQYEAIGTVSLPLNSFRFSFFFFGSNFGSKAVSPTIRTILSEHPNLKNVLLSVDKLRGNDREEALQHALGVSVSTVGDPATRIALDDVQTLRALAEAIESAVRGSQEGILGLDWDD